MKFIKLSAFLPSNVFHAQIGINTITPTATLDIVAQDSSFVVDRILTPRIGRLKDQTMASVPVSTLVYANDISTGSLSGIAIEINSTGFYYFDGTKWTVINTTTTNNNDWKTSGNIGTNATNNFIGTIDNQNLVFKRNNITAGFLGISNTSFEVGTLNNPTGIGRNEFGYQALNANTRGSQNTAIGFGVMGSNGGMVTGTFITTVTVPTTYYVGVRTINRDG